MTRERRATGSTAAPGLPDARLRAAEARDIDALRDVEVAANRPFAPIGMRAIADLLPMSADEWSLAIAEARAWIATDPTGDPVAFAVARIVDGNAHIEQVSVHPAWMRRGLGTRLLVRVEAWARDRGLPAMTLTTFVEVPWNAPYYRRLGFSDLPDKRMGPTLRALTEHNRETVLGRWPRIAMERTLATKGTT